MRLAPALLLWLLFAGAARAADYRCAGEEGGVLYDAPSRAATPLFFVTKDYPLEVISQTEAWVKVRDREGALSWIEKRSLGERHMVTVSAARAEAHVKPDEATPVSFTALKDVALEVLESMPGGWLHVRHADGSEGYLRASLVWGV
jgi:SH3-like domain-containing protein